MADCDAREPLKTLWRAMAVGGAADSLLVDGAAVGLMGVLVGAGRDRRTVDDQALGRDQLARVIEYIETHFAKPLRMDELAVIAGTPMAMFSKAFRFAVGQPPHAYLTVRPIMESRQLLAATDTPLAQITSACGFASLSHFRSTFLRRLGVGPSAQRAAARGEAGGDTQEPR